MNSEKHKLIRLAPLARRRAQNGVYRQTRARRLCGSINVLQN